MHLYYNRTWVFRLYWSLNIPPDHIAIYRHPLYTSRKALTFRDLCNVVISSWFCLRPKKRWRHIALPVSAQSVSLCLWVSHSFRSSFLLCRRTNTRRRPNAGLMLAHQARIQGGAQGRTPTTFFAKFFKKSAKLAKKLLGASPRAPCAPSFLKFCIRTCPPSIMLTQH